MFRNFAKQVRINLILTSLLIIAPATLMAVSPGDVIATSITLIADLDASGYNGSALRVGADNIIIDGGGKTITVNGNNAGFELNGHSFVTIKNAVVVSNTSGQGRGIYLNNSSDSQFENNTLSGLLNAIYVSGTNSRNTLHNNIMTGSTGNAFESHGTANNLDWVITDNTVTGGNGLAIYYRGRIGTINGNDFTGSASGLNLDNGNYSASPLVLTWQGAASGPNKNTFGGHTYNPLSLNNSSFITVNNWDLSSLYSGTWTNERGISLHNVNDSHFESNTMSGMFNAIYVSGTNSRNTLHNNIMTGSTNNAFESHGTANNLDWVITDNTITGGNAWAINYRGTPGDISGNDFSGSHSGLSLGNTHNYTLQANANTYNVLNTAVGLTTSNGNTIFGVHANGTSGTAISIGNSHNNVIDSLYSCGLDVGVNIGGVSNGNQILNSSIANAGLHAIRMGGSAVQNTIIDGSTFYQNNLDINDTGTNTQITNSSEAVSSDWCPQPPNEIPVADAGQDQTIASLGSSETVTLDGYLSSDADPSDVLTYSWVLNGTEVSQDESFQMNLGAGAHLFTLTVNDGNGATDSDDVLITITCDGLEQTLVILGGNGNVDDNNVVIPGQVHPYTEASIDGGQTWGPAYLIGWHPWGYVPGTNSWLNSGPTNSYNAGVENGPSSFTDFRVRFMVPDDVANPSMAFELKADNEATVSLNGVQLAHFVSGGNSSIDLSTVTALTTGLNEIIINLEDYHGLLGINFKIEVTMTSCETLAQLNSAPDADAGPDQNSEMTAVTLDGSGSSDPDANQLSYLWSEGGNVIATGVNPTINLVDGLHTITLEVSDGELSDTDEVVVDVHTNVAPVADAGLDQTLDCVPGSAEVTLDASGSSDVNGDALTYSWSLNDAIVGSDVSLTSNLTAGTHIFNVTVSDGQATHSDEVTVTIHADTEAPTLTLLGDSPANLNIHIVYVDGGYEVSDVCDKEVTVEVNGTVDHEAPGVYTITYTATDAAGNVTTVERAVTVINALPIAVAGIDQDIDCVVGSVTVNLDGSASSDADGDALTYSWTLDGSVVGSSPALSASLPAGEYTYTLTVSDGIDASSDDVVVTVVDDSEPPVITMLGDNPMDLGLYLEYVEAGIETEDACGSEVTVEISGSVDVNTPRTYTLTYTATDENGNASTEDRVVEVFNTAPEVVNAVDGVVLSFGDALLSTEIDLSTVFADVDVNDVLTYSFNSSNAYPADVSLTGSILSMSALDLGESLVEITATDDWGAQGSQTFTLLVNVTENLAGALLFAHSEIKIKKDVEVYSGNLLVNGPTSSHGDHDDDEDEDHDGDDEDDEDDDDDHDRGHYQIKIDKDSHVAAGYALMADQIEIKQGTLIESDVYTNDLDDRGDITGEIFGEVATPLFTTLPPFKTGAAGSENITVNKNQEVILEPGDYEKIVIKDRGTLTFTGGVYNIKKLEAKKYSHVRFEERSEVRVEDEIKFAKLVYVGPAGGSLIDASDIIFYVAGDHHHAAKLEQGVVFYGTIYAQEGEIELKKEVSFTGALLGDEIEIDKDSELTVDSYFGNQSSGLAKGSRVAWVEPEMEVEVPEFSDLSANYPNPFNPSTTIDFALNKPGQVSLKIYDIRGAEVAVIAKGFHEAGHYSAHFRPENLSSGTYLYVLTTPSFREVKRMVYLK